MPRVLPQQSDAVRRALGRDQFLAQSRTRQKVGHLLGRSDAELGLNEILVQSILTERLIDVAVSDVGADKNSVCTLSKARA